MQKDIGVTCPFTGIGNLPVPSEGSWALQVPDSNVWYFSHDEVESEGLNDCVGHLMGEEVDYKKVAAGVRTLQERGDLKQVGDWWFLNLPKLPRISLPSIAEIVIAQHGDQETFIASLTAEFQSYIAQLRAVLK